MPNPTKRQREVVVGTTAHEGTHGDPLQGVEVRFLLCLKHIYKMIPMWDYEMEEARAFKKWLAENALKSYTEADVFWSDCIDDESDGWVNVVTQVHLDGTIEMFNYDTKQMMIPH